MINQLAGNSWWQPGRDGNYSWFIEAGDDVYMATQSTNAWVIVDVPMFHRPYAFTQRIEKIIERCLADEHGCKYVVFDDGSSLQFFDDPVPDGMVRISSGGVTWRDSSDTSRKLSGVLLKVTIV